MAGGLDRKSIVSILVAACVRAALLLGVAGTIAWWQAWAFVLVQATFAGVAGTVLAKESPELLEERKRAAKDAKGWDKPLVLLTIGLLPQAQLVVAGLDRRFGWTTGIADSVTVAGLLALVLANAWGLWAVRSNDFFSSFARIQSDRGHVVASGGPYRFVRHPGYLGFSVAALATAAAFGSRPTLWIGAATVVLTVVRTALEDRMLRAELQGYSAYSEQVRFRLVPFVW